MKTYGQEVIDLMAQIGRPLDPWQAEIIRCAYGVQEGGLWAAYELMVFVARQNGKGGITEAIELAGLFLFKEKLILHSAHLFKTSTAAFRRLMDIIDANDWLSRRVNNFSRSKGDEGIYLTRSAGGGALQFVARTAGSGRGLTGSTNVFDEAYALTTAQYAAQTPTLATIPNPRIVYTSTPPDEDTGPMPDDAMLPSVRARGHAGDDRVACFEWSPPKRFDPHDVDLMHECNPALGIRISLWFLQKQLIAFEAAGKISKFSTEHLGQWPADPNEQWQLLSEADWSAALDPTSKPIRKGLALAVEMSLDRQWVSVSMAGARDDGLRHVEVGLSERGSGWVVPKLVDLNEKLQPCAIVVASGSPAAALVPDMEAAGLVVHVMSAGEVAAACGGLVDAIAGPTPEPTEAEPIPVSPRTVRHRGQPVLTTAIAGAATKKAGNTQTWDPTSAVVDITPGMGAGNALWAYAKYGNQPKAADPWVMYA